MFPMHKHVRIAFCYSPKVFVGIVPVASPEFSILVAHPFYQTHINDPEKSPQLGFSEFGIVVYPTSYLGVDKLCYSAQWKMNPAMYFSFENFIADPGYVPL
jgi:hypothetical protein